MTNNNIALKHLSIRADALRRAMDSVLAGSTPDHGKWVGFKGYIVAYNALANEYKSLTGNNINVYQTDKLKGSMDTVWPVQKEIFETAYTNILMLSSLLSEFDIGHSSSVSNLQDLLQANLRTVMFSKPERESEVQNAIETLLVGRGYQKGTNYDREAGKIKFSGKEFIPDFNFPSLNTALEVKLIKEADKTSKVIEEMCADIPAYLSAYETLLFCVYDLGAIRDVMEFCGGIGNHENVRICVIKH